MADPRSTEDDAPAPPGSPMRRDEPDAPVTPAEPARDPGPEVQRVTRDEGGEAPPPTGTEPEQGDQARELQQENAETSLDQPSS